MHAYLAIRNRRRPQSWIRAEQLGLTTDDAPSRCRIAVDESTMTEDDLRVKKQIEAGAKIVAFPTVKSCGVGAVRQWSGEHFVVTPWQRISLAVWYAAITLLCGWWSLPGISMSLGALKVCFSGGEDRTVSFLRQRWGRAAACSFRLAIAERPKLCGSILMLA